MMIAIICQSIDKNMKRKFALTENKSMSKALEVDLKT